MAIKKRSRITLGSIINQLVDRTNTDTKRLRILEQRSEVFENRVNSVEQNIITQRKDIYADISEVGSRLTKLNERVIKMENVLKEVVKQLKKTATKSDVKSLEQLIEIYNPLKSKFVTIEEVKKIMKGDEGGAEEK